MALPVWIRTPEELAALAEALSGAGAVAVDTEADSLHHYPGKLCLMQIADDRGRAHLVDPLALPTLAPLEPLSAEAVGPRPAPRPPRPPAAGAPPPTEARRPPASP